ncbi:MAG: ABC transporter permease [Spirochaetes bacterium]|nr:ABC transporter permease [Spirochaetota bacterium]
MKLERYILEFVLLTLCIVLALTAPGFFSTRNLLNVMRNVALQGVIAFGMTTVIISGEIDLSVGSAVAFSGCVAAWLTRALVATGIGASVAAIASIASVVVIGASIGVFTAFMRNRFSVPTFITTLALMTILSGAANLITGGFPITSFPDWFNFFGGGFVLGIPVPALVFLATFFIMQFVMQSTNFGRAVYATGGNAEAARLNGINVRKVKYAVIGLTGAFAAVTGIMVSSQIMSGTPTVAEGWELQIISAVIIGGTSLFGGEGRIWGTFVGVVFLGVIINGMTLLNISQYWQLVVRGLLILTAIFVNNLQLLRRA